MDVLSEWNLFVSREFTVFQDVKSVGLVTNYMSDILDNPQQTMMVFSEIEQPSCGTQGLGKGLQFLSFFLLFFFFLVVEMLSFKYLWAILVKVSLSQTMYIVPGLIHAAKYGSADLSVISLQIVLQEWMEEEFGGEWIYVLYG